MPLDPYAPSRKTIDGCSNRFSRSEAAALCALASVLLVGLIATEWGQLTPGDSSRDFSLLYLTAQRARLGQALYTQADPTLAEPLLNFNPPHMHAVLVPLTVLPLRVAYILWSCISLALLATVVRISARETGLRLNTAGWYLLIAGILGSVGVAATLRMGQISMWIALLITLAWRAARRNRWTSGIWLGLAMSLKPFLLLGLPVLLIRGRWRAAGIATLAGGGAMAAGGLWLGWSELTDWLAVFQTSRRPTTFALNASLAGLAGRADAPEGFTWLLSGVVCAVTLWRAYGSDDDGAWALWLIAALLCSPLGWVYYLPMLIGPLFAVAKTGRLPRWAWWLWPLFLPPPLSVAMFQQPLVVAVTLGSVFCWGLVALWIAVATAAHARPAVQRSSLAHET